MRILRIRGKNLASLADEFEVDFTTEPLDRAGLVAVTGPIGAGKTTLLDAMCVALFDRTPRFAERGGVEILQEGQSTGEGLRSNDVRGLLRHGAARGWAEVDFVGVDGQEYRSRWEIRRAHARADGRLQAQTMSLADPLTGRTLVAGNKGEVKSAIVARLGLDFEQFRRSVLLAQGEFAAFLEADPTERASLLERMTGTEIYGRLSMAAHRRLGQERERLEALEARTGRVEPLRAVERERLEAALGTAKHWLEVAGAEVERASRARRWWELDRELAERSAKARLEVEAAERQREGLDELREEVRRFERVADLRSAADASAEAQRELERTHAAGGEFAGRRAATQASRIAAEKSFGRGAAAAEEAQARATRLRPELARARRLDEQISTHRESLAEAQAEARESSAALSRAVEGERAARLASEASERELEAARQWLEEHTEWSPIVRDWGRMAAAIDRATRALETGRRFEARSEAARRERAEAREARVGAQMRGELAARIKRSRQRAARKADKAARALPDVADIEARRSDLERRGRALGRLERVAERSRVLEKRRVQVQSSRDEARAAEAADRDAAKACAAELVRHAEVLRESESTLRRLEAVMDLAPRRAELQDGDACPLCGATEHPLGHDHVADAMIDDQRERVAKARERKDELERAGAAHEARARSQQSRALTLGAELDDLATQEGSLAVEWVEAKSELADASPGEGQPAREESGQLDLMRPEGDGSLGDSPFLEGSESALARSSFAHGEAVERFRQLREEVDEARRAWLEAVREKEAAEQSHQQYRDEIGLHREREERSAAQERAALEGVESAAEEVSEALADIAQVLAHEGGGGAPLEADAEALRLLRAQWEERSAAWSAWSERAEAALPAVAEHRAELGRCQAAREALERSSSEAATRRDKLAASLAAAVQARAELLGGAQTEEFQAGLDDELAKAASALETARAELAEAEAATRVVEAQVQSNRAASAHWEAKVDQARSDLSGLCVARGLGEDALEDLERLRELPEGWLSEARAKLDAAEGALRAASAVWRERESRLNEHRAGPPPALSRDQAETRLRLAGQRQDALGDCRASLSAHLHHDERARREREELEPQLEEQRARLGLWRRMHEAIGSADGKRFREFAQSLTLDILVDYANAQLRELKPRYALRRIEGEDLELVLVDRDLADEVRSTRTLSGGESFLVSLALALGLAGLSSKNFAIDSLFIDEGFGTLDARAVDVAVDALASLQAQDRKIVLITHVPGLAERVGVEVRVAPSNGGRSRVRVHCAHATDSYAGRRRSNSSKSSATSAAARERGA